MGWGGGVGGVCAHTHTHTHTRLQITREKSHTLEWRVFELCSTLTLNGYFRDSIQNSRQTAKPVLNIKKNQLNQYIYPPH